MLKRYTHTNQNTKRDAVKKLENHLNLPIYSQELVTINKEEKVDEKTEVSLYSINH